MQNSLSDTPGDGLEPRVEQIASILLGSVNAPEQEIYRVSREIVSCLLSPSVGRDTAGLPADHELAETVHGEIVRVVKRPTSIKEPIAGPADHAGLARYRHKKTGSEYVLIGIGKIQAKGWYDPSKTITTANVDMREVAIYRSLDDGSLWVRPREEFEDGRFEAIAALSRATEAVAVKPLEPIDFQWRTIDGWVSSSSGSSRQRREYAEAMAREVGLGYRELYDAHPAALALIEELTETLRRVRKRIDVIEPNDSAEIPYWNGQHEQARGMIDTALASAKRFRTGE